jgi:hypothetical protein
MRVLNLNNNKMIDCGRANPFSKDCPKCDEGLMRKDCDADEINWWWVCDICGYSEHV